MIGNQRAAACDATNPTPTNARPPAITPTLIVLGIVAAVAVVCLVGLVVVMSGQQPEDRDPPPPAKIPVKQFAAPAVRD